MDKASEMGQASAVGSLHLFLGVSISTVILAVGTIILGIFISQGDYGLYAVALIPASLFFLFQDWGVGSALTRYCAKYRATNEEFEQRKIIIAGLIFELLTGIILTVVLILIANFVAYTVFHKPESAFLIVISSITILTSSIGIAVNGIFIGFEQMKLSRNSTIIQAVVQGVFAPILVYLGYGAMGAVVGYTLSIVASSIISLFFL
jgi:O-antigen/teichoic acid export membrane protein